MRKINILIPFESSVNFDNDVKEICSISLEHEITKNEKEILGNFFISGTYKEHELSINTLDFNYTIPFSVDLNDEINLDTLDFSIDNFTYDIDGKVMNIKIDYIVNADKKEEIREEIPEEETRYEELDPLEEREEINLENIKDNFNTLEDDYEKYHVHIVKENETIETISSLYKCPAEEIFDINKISKIELNQKILIIDHNE